LFIHGFGGDAAKTWGNFPSLLVAEPGLAGWDTFSLGYHTGLRMDIAGIWTADPDLAALSILLKGIAALDPLNGYESLTLIAHSMGGLIVQKALLDDPSFRQRIGHVFLFGTPSAGLQKAARTRFWKRQIRDMSASGTFIKDLRERWKKTFPGPLPFKFWAVAGDLDQFVPPESSIAPFPTAQWVVPGNHISMVKPEDAQSLSFKIVLEGIMHGASTTGAGDSARRAVELRDFRKAIDLLWERREGLDEDGLVLLALALEGVGRSKDAFELLKYARPDYTDALGVLAGRLKRRWLVERQQADADRAMELYQQGYDLSVQNARSDQAFYHGINIAFMQLAWRKNLEAAREMARNVIEQCEVETKKGKRTVWCVATEGEAYLYLGQSGSAFLRYQEAVKARPRPRELDSIRMQAIQVAIELGNDSIARELERILL